jgi:hypothetical protein
MRFQLLEGYTNLTCGLYDIYQKNVKNGISQ